MAKKRKRSSKSRKIPVLATAGMAAFGLQAYNGYKAGGVKEMMVWTIGTDSNGKFHPEWLVRNAMPIVAGAAGSMIATKAKINRYVRVPFVKL